MKKYFELVNEREINKVKDILDAHDIEYVIDTPKGHFIRSEIEFDIESEELPESFPIEEAVDFIGDHYNFCDGLMENYREALRDYVNNK